jgi:hypothetical protein
VSLEGFNGRVKHDTARSVAMTPQPINQRPDGWQVRLKGAINSIKAPSNHVGTPKDIKFSTNFCRFGSSGFHLA